MTLPSVVVLVVFLLLLSHYSVNGGSEQPGLGQESLPSITTRVDHHGAWRTRKPLSPSSAHETAQIVVNGDDSIATVDDDFLCGTLDWWPPEKCDYGTCSWGNASLLNLVCVASGYILFEKSFIQFVVELNSNLKRRHGSSWLRYN